MTQTGQTSTSTLKRKRKGLTSERQWSPDETLELIDLCASRSILFNAADLRHLDGSFRENLLKEMSSVQAIPQEDIARKMVSLNSYYGQLRGKHDATKRKSVSAGDEPEPTRKYYESFHI